MDAARDSILKEQKQRMEEPLLLALALVQSLVWSYEQPGKDLFFAVCFAQTLLCLPTSHSIF